jgi:hypothetical protein
MKEANLLIFRDFSVKIGDFGVSIKMKDLPLKEGESDEYEIKGLTPGYITDLIQTYFKDESKMERKDLIMNDYYALFKTFDNLYEQFKEKIDKDSYFCKLLNEAKDNKNLKELLEKYTTIIQNDDKFIFDLCDQFINEEKIFAIPNVLKLHRYGLIVKNIQDYFV